jgi:hypothetical protein
MKIGRRALWGFAVAVAWRVCRPADHRYAGPRGELRGSPARSPLDVVLAG